MCGIFCSILYNKSPFLNQLAKKSDFKESNKQFIEFSEYLQQRGPDCYQSLYEEISSSTVLQFAGSVLWMQGDKPVQQPVIDEDGNILLWNGDIFSGPLVCEGNDTKYLSERLLNACRKNREVQEVFAEIRGPYSFIYYIRKEKRLYFGRDVIGRHSLLLGYTQRNLTLTSVASRKLEGFVEVPAIGIFELSLEKDGCYPIRLYPWSHIPEDVLNESVYLPQQLLEKFEIDLPIKTYILTPERRNKLPTREDQEMWVTSDPNLSVSQLMDKLSTSDSKTRIQNTMTLLSGKSSVKFLIEDLIATLKDSVRVRLEKRPDVCQSCAEILIEEKVLTKPCRHTKVAVLFSGGLDSSILAALAHSFIPIDEPIDLLNVAFEKYTEKVESKPRKGFSNAQKTGATVINFMVPDRVTGLETLSELRELFPDRVWNFVQIDITQEELKKERERVIADLIYPLNSVLDDSLGCALWFASRGRGILGKTGEKYTSPARVLLSGIGADEQLGGYMRHRTTLKHKGGWEALDKELQMELRRISRRNLGRDDRIVSSHGRQCRMPFLDEDVVNFLNFIPPWYRCYPVDSMPPGMGDKLLLRLSAWVLGLKNVSNMPKRAMQFGSRIANSREKAGDVSERL